MAATSIATAQVAPGAPRSIGQGERRATWLVHLALAGTVLVPHLAVGGLVVGADDLAALILLPILSIGLAIEARRALAPATLVIACLWLAILVHGVVMGVVASLQFLGQVDPPTEMWQYVKRIAFFYAAFALASRSTQTIAPAFKAITAVLLVAALIGILQIGSGGLSETLSSVYMRSDAQLERLVDRALATRRTYGVAGHPVAWGGFCMFMAAMALPFVLVRRRYRREPGPGWRAAFSVLLALATLNLLFSVSRVALVAFLFVLVLKGGLELFLRQGGLSAFIKWLAWVGGTLAVALYFALDRLALLAFRFMTLADQGGGGRVDQVVSGLSLIDSGATLLTGVGNAVQRLQSVSHGVEVEPVYLLVNYGLVGTLCRYGLLLSIATIAIRATRSSDEWSSAAGMAALLALGGYAVFSLGYFFFQELYVGMVPWLLFGMVTGLHQLGWSEKCPVRSSPSADYAELAGRA